MKSIREFVTKSLVRGFLIAVPIYLAILLLLKAIDSVAGLVRPLTALAPEGLSSGAAEDVLACLVV
jgi:hypothetical protein